jgi:site-specific DNA recombinase
MRDKESEQRLDTLIEKAAIEAGYSEGFGVSGCDLTEPIWWAAYTRQSWEEQANNNRLPEYLLTCAREAKKLGVIVPREYILYDTVTGEHLERPDMTSLRRLIAGRRVAGVIFPALDRLSREPLHQQIFELEAAHYIIQIHYADAPSGSDPGSQFARAVLAHAAKLVKLTNRRNNSSGNVGRVVAGNVPAGKVPYGYNYCAEYQDLGHGRRKLTRAWWEVNDLDAEGTLVPGSEAWAVAQIFNWIGHEVRSTYWVAAELNRLGIKPRYADKWSPALICFVIKNHAYTGKHAYNKASYIANPQHPLGDFTAEIKRTIRRPKPQNEWAHFDVPALVSEELWQRAKQNVSERGRGRGKAGKSIQALFRGRVFCPKCGYVMRLHRDSKCSWLTYYVCKTERCKMRFIRVSWLDGLGWDEVVRLLRNPALVEAQLKRSKGDDSGIQKRIRLESFRKREAERKIAKIHDELLDDRLFFTKDEAANKVVELRAVIQKAEAEITRLEEISQVTKQTQETVEATRRALEKLRDINLKAASFQQRVELVAQLGIKMYPSEDLTYIRMFCGLNTAEPQKISCQKMSIASPKL